MIIRINMTTKEIQKEVLPEKYRLLGGRGFTSTVLFDEVDPACDPLGPNNKLVIATGILGGTTAPCSGRISIGAKSPLTGGIKESNAGGTAAHKLAKLGIRGIIVEGQPLEEKFFMLKISSEGIEIIPADEIEGLGNYDTVETLQNKYGKDKSIVSIGIAGERGYSNSSVAISDPEGHPTRHCGRGGMGAVMGSKKIKALIIDDSKATGVTYEHPEEFKKTTREWAKELVQTRKTLTEYGTANLVNVMNTLGALPTRNFSSGSFEHAEQISGEKLKQLLAARGGVQGHPCQPGCVIRCSNIFVDEKGNYVTSSLEYETIGLIGSNCGISDLDFIAELDRFCDDFGMDTMEFGVAIGIIMEAGLVPFGDKKEMLKLIEEIKKDTVLGKMIAQGATITGKTLGVKRIPTVKGQALSAYDPRVLKATGVTYATSTMGADHTIGNCLPGRKGYRPITTKEFIDSNNPQDQLELSKDLQVMTTVCDNSGLCFFVGPTAENMIIITKLINSKFGTDLTSEDLLNLSKEIMKTEVEFNKLAGITQKSNRLPEFFYTEKINDFVFDVSNDKLEYFYEQDF